MPHDLTVLSGDTPYGALVKYEAACRAVAEAKSVDEAKELRNHAEIWRAYARQAKNKDMEADCAEIRFRAERRIGQMIKAQRETVGLADGGDAKRARVQNGPEFKPTLADAGIDKHLADRARKLAEVEDSEFEAILSDWRDKIELEDKRVTLNLLDVGGKHVRGTLGTGENEWFTPSYFIEAARQVMGGIDLDPASNPLAQQTVKAGKIFTKEDDGLAHEWNGKVWLNPPYAQPWISHFADKMAEELQSGRVIEAIMLTHNYTDTTWFHTLEREASLICFTKGRVKFTDPDGKPCAPTQGQVFFYFGPNDEQFREVFQQFGFVR